MTRPFYRTRSGVVTCLAVCLVLAASTMAADGFADSVDGRPNAQTNWFVDLNQMAVSAHAKFKCEDCHGSMVENGRSHPDKTLPDFLKRAASRAFDYSRCEPCHKLSYQRYLRGEHAAALSKEIAEMETVASGIKKDRPAPTCGDCHASHYDRSGMSRVDVGKRMISRCGRCHRSQTDSYLENIHGRVGVHMENPAAAFCSDCHQAHTMTSLKKPTDALPACRRCHKDVAEEFTNVVIHASLDGLPTSDSPKYRSILWIQRIKMIALAVVTLSLIFFFGHSLLWILRELHEKLRKH